MKKINNKKIIIVGNGSSVLNNNYKDIIDSFSTVGRINNYKLNSYKAHIGSKTSIWFNGANQGLYKRKKNPSKIIVLIPSIVQNKYSNCHQIIKSRLGVQNNQYEMISMDKMEQYEKKCNSKRLTTGTASILWAMENYKEVYIHGFDFFIDSKSHYFDNKLISVLKNKGIIPKAKKHDMNKEKTYISNLIENGKLNILNG